MRQEFNSVRSMRQEFKQREIMTQEFKQREIIDTGIKTAWDLWERNLNRVSYMP